MPELQSQSMPRIHQLDSIIADQIAAGEVIERPAAALKELLENSIDAQAKTIRVKLTEGGVSRLEVADDGLGIVRDDVAMAVSRHATSKLYDNLLKIETMGFRGEALAAMAAVSRMQISSRPADQKLGHQISVEAGQITLQQDIARPVGTTVTVEDLFASVPARKAFLRSQSAETGQCLQIFHRLALANPHIHWEISVDGKRRFVYSATDSAKERMLDFFGQAQKLHVEGSKVLAFENEREGMRVHGWLLPTNMVIPSSKNIFTFVNGRIVKDKLIQQAVLQAVREVLFGNMYPQLCLYLDIDPESVDVNVHPAKAELRFRDPSKVFSLIRKAVLQAIESVSQPVLQAQPRYSTFETAGEQSGGQQASFATGMQTMFNQKNAAVFAEPTELPERNETYSRSGERAFTGDPQQYSAQSEGENAEPTVRPQYLGSAKNTYLICQDHDGLIVIDQHAAHERIMYEKLRESQNLGSAMQLLVPIEVELDETLLASLEKHFQKLSTLGLDINKTRSDAVQVSSIPALLMRKSGAPRISIGRFIRNLAAQVEENGEDSADDLADMIHQEVLETVASQSCHDSVRAGQSLHPQEALALIDEMAKTKFAGHCPHGRPTAIRMSWNDLEKMFKRTV